MPSRRLLSIIELMLLELQDPDVIKVRLMHPVLMHPVFDF